MYGLFLECENILIVHSMYCSHHVLIVDCFTLPINLEMWQPFVYLF